MMAFKQTSVRDIVRKIEKKQYVIPAIQRSFVWSPGQIERLFDSLLCGYPIGGLLFWKMNRSFIERQKHFYKFMIDYNEQEEKDNERILTKDLDIEKEDIIAILDGQQRLTSMCVGLLGSYTRKKKYAPKNNPDNYQKLCLYLNLAQKNNDENLDSTYQFEFKIEEEQDEKTEQSTWFKVKDFLEPKITGSVYTNESKYKRICEILNSGEEGKFAKNTFELFKEILSKDTINYYEDKNKEMNNALDIFVRTNSGGTPLSKSDLLLSTCTAYWQDLHARDNINNLVKMLNNVAKNKNFEFNTDFVMKSCLMLCEKNIKFKVENFNEDNVNDIEKNWNGIEKSIVTAVEVAAKIGFNKDNLTSHNVLIPVAYYFFKKKVHCLEDVDKKNLINIQSWIIRALLGGIFGGSTDSTLAKSREIINKADINIFPWQLLVAKFIELDFSEKAIDEFLDEDQKKKKIFLLLSLLCSSDIDKRENLDIDHIFPDFAFNKTKLKKIGLEKKLIEKYFKLKECIPNKQLLPSDVNRYEKTKRMPADWLRTCTADGGAKWKKENYIGYLPENLMEFEKFYNERKILLKKALLEKLCMEKPLP